MPASIRYCQNPRSTRQKVQLPKRFALKPLGMHHPTFSSEGMSSICFSVSAQPCHSFILVTSCLAVNKSHKTLAMCSICKKQKHMAQTMHTSYHISSNKSSCSGASVQSGSSSPQEGETKFSPSACRSASRFPRPKRASA